MPRITSVTNVAGAILMIAAAVWLALGARDGAGAAAARTYVPQPVKPAWQSAANRTEIVDPYKRLSGVIAVPPAEMMRPGSGGDPSWLGPLSPLVPPVFGPNVDASLNNPANQNETTVAVDPENDQHVIVSANDYRANLKPWVYASSDGGTTFVNYQVPGTVSLFYGDPAMAFGRGGNAYFTYLGYQSICGGQGGMYASRSTNAGATFSAPIQLAANLNNGTIAVLQDKEYVAVDTNSASPYLGTVYVGWTKYTFAAGANCGSFQSQISAPAVLSRSTDNGLTWSVPITASPPISDNNGGVVPAVGRQGEVYLYYIGAATQSQPYYDSVLVSRSTDGGLTFPHFARISDLVDLPSPLPPTSFRNNPFGAIAADQVLDGYVYAVWSDYRNGDADILLSRSTDSAATWSPPVRLNDDPVGNQKDQFFPWIASAPDGRIHVGWFDRREDPQNITYKEYYTSSTDHGATWEANVAVSSAPSNPGSSTFIGDYSGIAASDGVVIPTWTDIRTGANQNAYIARGVYSTTGVTVTPTPPATNTSTATTTATATATVTPAATATPTACTLTFTDVPPTNTFYPFVRCLACRDIISGYQCGGTGEPCNPSNDPYFRPNNYVTRGQHAKIVSESAGFDDQIPPSQWTFTDVPYGSTFWLWVERLSNRSVMAGYQCGSPNEPCDNLNRPYFRPGNGATRGQLTKIVSNAAGFNDLIGQNRQTFADVPPNSTFWLYIERLLLNRPAVMSGYPCGGPGEPCDSENRPYFRPNNPLTRGQTSQVVANTFFPNCNPPARK